MKRVILIVFCCVLLLCGCETEKNEKGIYGNKIVGVWISYSELDEMLSSKDFKMTVEKSAEELKNFFVTDVFIHVRPFCDSIYKSEFFPLRKTASLVDFDVLEYMISVFHSKNIRVHAWINPYRVQTGSNDTETISKDSIVYNWIKDPMKASNICFSNGIYLNPASYEAVGLIINGIKEILTKYDVDGIHFDDYFYPTTEENFDKLSYLEYLNSAENGLSISEWRRNNVNGFISSVRLAVKQMNEKVIFSISPAASVDKNYNNLYADIMLWKENGYADWVIPQLYFGYDYPIEEFKFKNLLDEWCKIFEKSDTKLIIGLAPYKVGNNTDIESEEWKSGDLLLKETKDSFESAKGVCFFSYSSLLGKGTLQTNERNNLYTFLDKYIP